MEKIDMIGRKFGKLTVLEECEERNKQNQIIYKCLCDCGNIHYVIGFNLRSGSVKSCGCSKGQSHGKYKTRLYRIFHNMKTRCYNKNYYQYKDWGGRGIVICDEWLNDFMSFYDWSMEHGYQDNLTIDRINVDGNYEPNNCRWVDMKTQNRNKHNNACITYNGKTQTIMDWAKELNLKHNTIYQRKLRGWKDYECLFGKHN